MTQFERLKSYYSLPGAKHPNAEALVLAAAQAYDSAVEDGRLTSHRLDALVAGVSHPSCRVWGHCASLMLFAMKKWKEARDALIQLMEHPQSSVRFAAMCCLGSGLPDEFVEAVIRIGLWDKSAKVRWKSVDVANSLGCRSLLSEIKEAIERERNLKAKATMEFSHLFLRDGFVVGAPNSDPVRISIRIPSGGGTGITVPRAEFEKAGAEALVAKHLQECALAACRDRHG